MEDLISKVEEPKQNSSSKDKVLQSRGSKKKPSELDINIKVPSLNRKSKVVDDIKVWMDEFGQMGKTTMDSKYPEKHYDEGLVNQQIVRPEIQDELTIHIDDKLLSQLQ